MSNVMDDIKNSILDGVQDAMTEAGGDVCDNMKSQLIADGHTGTGELLGDIKYSITEDADGIHVDVTLPEYAKFIDSGTGSAHGVPGGREGSWRYQDRAGNWHTTDGMDADPFIDKSTVSVVDELSKIISKQISNAIRRRGG